MQVGQVGQVKHHHLSAGAAVRSRRGLAAIAAAAIGAGLAVASAARASTINIEFEESGHSVYAGTGPSQDTGDSGWPTTYTIGGVSGSLAGVAPTDGQSASSSIPADDVWQDWVEPVGVQADGSGDLSGSAKTSISDPPRSCRRQKSENGTRANNNKFNCREKT